MAGTTLSSLGKRQVKVSAGWSQPGAAKRRLATLKQNAPEGGKPKQRAPQARDLAPTAAP